MCGIIGICGVASTPKIHEAVAAIGHRGPDGHGVYHDHDNGVSLGHTRLSIIDLSPTGSQPMSSEDGSIVLTYNGEIYNYRELRQELVSSGSAFRGTSDTEVLLNLYLRYGDALLSKLNGMFAFAIWDKRKRALLVARDEMGVKPLYFAQKPGEFVFGSELKAILQVPGISRTVNAPAVRDTLTYLWTPSPRTMLHGVAKLEPGHAMWIREATIQKKWRWAALLTETPLTSLSRQEAILAVREATELAVQRQLVSDVPVGAFLSGGVDSSAVVACARARMGASRMQCFTIAIDKQLDRSEGFSSDVEYARLMARDLDVELHEIPASESITDELPRMIWHLEEPQGDLAPLNVLLISRMAREAGIKVLLSGAGGDDIFSGYRRHTALIADKWLSHIPDVIREMVASSATYLPAGLPQARRLRKGLASLRFRGNQRIAQLFEWLERGWVDRLIAPDFREASVQENSLEQSLDELPETVAPLNKMLYLECRHFLADHNLNYTDKMSMATGVEVRVPLLDRDLVRLAFSLPPEYKQKGREGKWVFREAMRPLLPPQIFNRPKTGFGLPLRYWLRGPLAPLMRDTLSPEALKRRGIFDSNAVQALIKANSTGQIDAAYPILSIMCTELWCRAFIDGKVPD
jgi:asparagine synthase (glutamine-hydrolysing)